MEARSHQVQLDAATPRQILNTEEEPLGVAIGVRIRTYNEVVSAARILQLCGVRARSLPVANFDRGLEIPRFEPTLENKNVILGTYRTVPMMNGLVCLNHSAKPPSDQVPIVQFSSAPHNGRHKAYRHWSDFQPTIESKTIVGSKQLIFCGDQLLQKSNYIGERHQ